MEKHTPEPSWASSKRESFGSTPEHYVITDADRNTIARVYLFESYARLIAAAPDLYDALEWVERELCVLVTDDDGSGVFIRGTGTELIGFGIGRDAMRATLKKAKGR